MADGYPRAHHQTTLRLQRQFVGERHPLPSYAFSSILGDTHSSVTMLQKMDMEGR